jgi:hypothetical protein
MRRGRLQAVCGCLDRVAERSEDFAGPAGYETCRHDVTMNGRFVAFESPKQHIRCERSDGFYVLKYQRNSEDISQSDVVKADKGDIVMAAKLAKGLDCTDRDEDLAGEERRWRVGKQKELFKHRRRLLGRMNFVAND